MMLEEKIRLEMPDAEAAENLNLAMGRILESRKKRPNRKIYVTVHYFAPDSPIKRSKREEEPEIYGHYETISGEVRGASDSEQILKVERTRIPFMCLREITIEG